MERFVLVTLVWGRFVAGSVFSLVGKVCCLKGLSGLHLPGEVLSLGRFVIDFSGLHLSGEDFLLERFVVRKICLG